MEQVNHPKHYNQHPAGIECIDIIRHYTCDIANALKYLWRAGLKGEIGKEAAEKEIEDLEKALWYIEDYHKHFTERMAQAAVCASKAQYGAYFKQLTGYDIKDVYRGYPSPVRDAIENLLMVGIIHQGGIKVCSAYRKETSIDAIQMRICEIRKTLIKNEMTELEKAIAGQPIDGEDYVSKPGGVRKTEPDQYDPLNMVVAWGRAYSLSSELRKKSNGAFYTPCQNCALMDVCYDDWRHPEESQCHNICRLHGAANNQYYREVGTVKYSPTHGTVEVVDEMKELMLINEDDE